MQQFRRKVSSLNKLVVISFICSFTVTKALAQSHEVFNNLDSALMYPGVVKELVIDSTCYQISPRIGELIALEVLRIDRSPIQELPLEIFRLPKLRILSLVGIDRVNVDSVLNNIKQSKSIEVLALDRIKVHYIPKLSIILDGIKVLQISYADLQSLSGISAIMPNLSSLSIRGNSNCRYEDELSGLVGLRILDVSDCDLERLPEQVLNVKNLMGLIMANNEELDMDALFLQLERFKSLRILVLDSCRIRKLPHSVRGLNELDELSLSFNMLSRLPLWITLLPKLRRFNARNNEIDELPSDLWVMNRLSYVDLRYNRIRTIAAEDIELPLVQLYLEGNPLDESTLAMMARWFPGWIDVLH